MANVVAIETFVNNVNAAVNSLLVIREDLAATDRLWLSLTAAAKNNIKAQLTISLDEAKLLVAALQVP